MKKTNSQRHRATQTASTYSHTTSTQSDSACTTVPTRRCQTVASGGTTATRNGVPAAPAVGRSITASITTTCVTFPGGGGGCENVAHPSSVSLDDT